MDLDGEICMNVHNLHGSGCTLTSGYYLLKERDTGMPEIALTCV